MARKTVARTLLPLARLFPRFRGFHPSDHQLASLQRMLRQAIRRVQRNQPHAFYSMREVSEFFGVPLSNVALAYKKLAEEGLLTQVRGSMTLVAGRKQQSRTSVRAVVGVPIWVDGFAIVQDLPPFHPAIEDELWRYNILCHFIFYRHSEQADPSFAERLLAHQLDAVVWFVPPVNAIPCMRLIQDNGVRQIVIGDKTRIFPSHQYFLDWDDALHRGIQHWKQEKIASVVISRPPVNSNLTTMFPSHDLFTLQQALNQKRLPYTVSDFRQRDFGEHVADLIREPNVGIIFVNYYWIATLLSFAQKEMIQLFQKRRVLLTRVPTNLPAITQQDVALDLIHLDWQTIVRRVAKDLATQRHVPIHKPVTFPARWQPRVRPSQLGA